MSVVRLVPLLILALVLFPTPSLAGGSVFTVNDPGNAGDMNLLDQTCDSSGDPGIQCTLRAAIQESNDEPSIDAIHFSLGAGGVQTIMVDVTDLPVIAQRVTIDGTTQPGCPDPPCIVINGSLLMGFNHDAIRIESDGSTVRGLVIQSFSGFGVYLLEASENTVSGNYLGTDATGMTALGNDYGVYIVHGNDNVIGGEDLEDRNVVSGNNGVGIGLGGNVSGNTVLNNYVGVGVDGETPIPNSTGVQVQNLPTSGRARVGGAGFDEPGPNTVARNVISGNTNTGLCLCDASETTVTGNLIGTDASGENAVPNGEYGIWMRGDDNIIGGDSSAERNVVSANAQGGIRANPDDLAAARRNTIQGNYVGLDADGDEPLGNGGDGIRLIADPMETGETMDNVVAGNVVGANAAAGISIFTEAHDNQVFSNFVGVTQSGDPIGNAGPGVLISGASGNEVGSTEGDGNTIANNGDAGVKINNVEFVTNHNTIRGNSIHTNTMLGIDLSKLANDDIQAPVITGPLRAGAEIAGTACSACTIDIYSDDVDEGRIYEGSTIANGAGNWSFSQPVSGPFTTATATDSAGNTSEFSAPVVSPEPPTPTPTSEPTETPEPTATPTPGPTETPEPTQTPQPSGTAPPKHIHGDTDCDADADSVDALFVLREVAGFPPSKCIFAGDVDCDGDRDSVDALGILRHVAALPPLVQQEPCPDIGTPV